MDDSPVPMCFENYGDEDREILCIDSTMCGTFGREITSSWPRFVEEDLLY